MCVSFSDTRGLNMDESYNWSSRDCSKANLLLTRQHKVCRNNLNLMKYVAESAKLAKEECKEQFRSRLWDCSTINRAPSYGYDLRLGMYFEVLFDIFYFLPDLLN